MSGDDAIRTAVPAADPSAVATWERGALKAGVLQVGDRSVDLSGTVRATLGWAPPSDDGERALVLEVAQVTSARERVDIGLRASASEMPAFAGVGLIALSGERAEPIAGTVMRAVLAAVHGAMAAQGEVRWQPRGELVTVRSAALATVDEAALAEHGVRVKPLANGGVALHTPLARTFSDWTQQKQWMFPLIALAATGFVISPWLGLALSAGLFGAGAVAARKPRATVDADRLVVGKQVFFREQVRDCVPGRARVGILVVALDGVTTWCGLAPNVIADAVRTLWRIEPIPALAEMAPAERSALPAWARVDVDTAEALDARWHEGTLVCGEVALREGEVQVSDRKFDAVDVRLFRPQSMDRTDDENMDQSNQPQIKDLITRTVVLRGKSHVLEPLVDAINAAAGAFRGIELRPTPAWEREQSHAQIVLEAGNVRFRLTPMRIHHPAGAIDRAKIKGFRLDKSRVTFLRTFETLNVEFTCPSSAAAVELVAFLEDWRTRQWTASMPAPRAPDVLGMDDVPDEPPPRRAVVHYLFFDDTHLAGPWHHWREIERHKRGIDFELAEPPRGGTLRIDFGPAFVEVAGERVAWDRMGKLVVDGDTLTLTRGWGPMDDLVLDVGSPEAAAETKRLIESWRRIVAAHRG